MKPLTGILVALTIFLTDGMVVAEPLEFTAVNAMGSQMPGGWYFAAGINDNNDMIVTNLTGGPNSFILRNFTLIPIPGGAGQNARAISNPGPNGQATVLLGDASGNNGAPLYENGAATIPLTPTGQPKFLTADGHIAGTRGTGQAFIWKADGSPEIDLHAHILTRVTWAEKSQITAIVSSPNGTGEVVAIGKVMKGNFYSNGQEENFFFRLSTGELRLLRKFAGYQPPSLSSITLNANDEAFVSGGVSSLPDPTPGSHTSARPLIYDIDHGTRLVLDTTPATGASSGIWHDPVNDRLVLVGSGNLQGGDVTLTGEALRWEVRRGSASQPWTDGGAKRLKDISTPLPNLTYSYMQTGINPLTGCFGIQASSASVALVRMCPVP